MKEIHVRYFKGADEGIILTSSKIIVYNGDGVVVGGGQVEVVIPFLPGIYKLTLGYPSGNEYNEPILVVVDENTPKRNRSKLSGWNEGFILEVVGED